MKKTGIIVFFIFVSNLLSAQDHLIRGVVHTFDSIPLIGAEIQVKSTKQSVLTDTFGNFIVFCNSEDRLKVMARGFYNQNVKINENTKLVAVNLTLKPGEKKREYAIGYGYVSDEDKTTAVTGLNTNDPSYQRYSDMYDLIRGQFAGVQITNGEIIIRGAKSFMGSSAALIVVDGVIMDAEYLNTLSPIQVKSIDVIKDGSAAVYGSRGANGVILIETRKGGDEIK
ncbi:TonB-dependent receptor plug domain-containing protein [Bacteroidota bacterium]